MKGETADFQIVVHGLPDRPTVLRGLTVTDLTGPAGRIGAEHAVLYREHFVFVPGAQHAQAPAGAGNVPDSGDLWYPDALIPFSQDRASAAYAAVPCVLAQGENAVFWIDWQIPVDAAAGMYTGAYAVDTDAGLFRGAITLRVWNARLPAVPTLWTSVSLQPPADQDPAAVQTLLDHGMSLANGMDPAQYAAMKGQQYADTGFWGDISFGDTEIADPPSQEAVAARVRELRAAVGPSVRLVNYTVDEIESVYDDPRYHQKLRQSLYQWRKVLRANGVALLAVCKPYTDLLDDRDLGGRGEPLVDIFVTLDTLYEAPYAAYAPGDRCAEIAAKARAKGCEIWTYTALVQDGDTPAWLLDYAPVNYRVSQGFINQAIGATGTLYWTANAWPDSPWIQPWTETYSQAPGEGILVYPGREAGVPGVVPSVRLKWIRDGIRDYDYIHLAKETGHGQEAMDIVRSVARDFTDWTHSAAVLLNGRRLLGELLDRGTAAAEA